MYNGFQIYSSNYDFNGEISLVLYNAINIWIIFWHERFIAKNLIKSDIMVATREDNPGYFPCNKWRRDYINIPMRYLCPYTIRILMLSRCGIRGSKTIYTLYARVPLARFLSLALPHAAFGPLELAIFRDSSSSLLLLRVSYKSSGSILVFSRCLDSPTCCTVFKVNVVLSGSRKFIFSHH